MTLNTDVKWFMFDNTNAPQLTNTWGCINDVLDACLVNGFGAQAVQSITVDPISKMLVTVEFGVAHNLKQTQVIKISGANQSEFNGEHRILSSSATSFTYELLKESAVLSSTGTITCALPPLGWKKEFAGSQKAVYRGNNGLDDIFLRVDSSCSSGAPDNGAKFAKVTMCDAMSGIDTFDGIQVPYLNSDPLRNHTFSNNSHGWFKWYYAVANHQYFSPQWRESDTPVNANRKWIIVGDESFFIIANTNNTLHGLMNIYGFGKVKNLTGNTNNYLLIASESYGDVSGYRYASNIDGIGGFTASISTNSFLFYNTRTGLADYRKLQAYMSAPFSVSIGNLGGTNFGSCSGSFDGLPSYTSLGYYIGFDMFGMSQNLPGFNLPFVKSLAQVSGDLNLTTEGMAIKCNYLGEGASTGYLLNTKER